MGARRWRGLGAVVPGSFLRLPGAGMGLLELRLARVGRTAWDAGGEPGRCRGCGLVFAQDGWVWVWFLSPFLSPSQRLLFLCFSVFAPSRPRSWAVGLWHTPLHPRTCRSWGTPWEGRSSPSVPVKGFREESEHGELFLLQRAQSWELLVLASGSIRTRGRAQCMQSSPSAPSLLPRPTRLSLFNNLERIGCKN